MPLLRSSAVAADSVFDDASGRRRYVMIHVIINPLTDVHCNCHVGTAIMHPVSDRVKRLMTLFVIFDMVLYPKDTSIITRTPATANESRVRRCSRFWG